MEITIWGREYYIRRPWTGNMYDPENRRKYRRNGFPPYEYFAGYDFMGTAKWVTEDWLGRYSLEKDEAISILNDLKAAYEEE